MTLIPYMFSVHLVGQSCIPEKFNAEELVRLCNEYLGSDKSVSSYGRFYVINNERVQRTYI